MISPYNNVETVELNPLTKPAVVGDWNAMHESGRGSVPCPVGAGSGVGGGGVCAQGPRPEHIAVDGARIERKRNRATKSPY